MRYLRGSRRHRALGAAGARGAPWLRHPCRCDAKERKEYTIKLPSLDDEGQDATAGAGPPRCYFMPPSLLRERTECAVGAGPGSCAPPERGERVGCAVPVVTAPRERRECAVRAAPVAAALMEPPQRGLRVGCAVLVLAAEGARGTQRRHRRRRAEGMPPCCRCRQSEGCLRTVRTSGARRVRRSLVTAPRERREQPSAPFLLPLHGLSRRSEGSASATPSTSPCGERSAVPVAAAPRERRDHAVCAVLVEARRQSRRSEGSAPSSAVLIGVPPRERQECAVRAVPVAAAPTEPPRREQRAGCVVLAAMPQGVRWPRRPCRCPAEGARGTQVRPRRRREEGAKGARRPRRNRCFRAAGARGPRQPPRPRRRRAEGTKGSRRSRRPCLRRAPGAAGIRATSPRARGSEGSDALSPSSLCRENEWSALSTPFPLPVCRRRCRRERSAPSASTLSGEVDKDADSAFDSFEIREGATT